MSVYPESIEKAAFSPRRTGGEARPDAHAREASLVCGCFISISLEIDAGSGCVRDAACRSNGCGYLIAFAEEICGAIIGRPIVSLSESARRDIASSAKASLGGLPASRAHCLDLIERSVAAALAAYRARVIGEYNGDDALVCTCFGVSEAAIEACIRDNSLSTVDEVIDICRAGGGCGSCQPIVQEMLDMARREAA